MGAGGDKEENMTSQRNAGALVNRSTSGSARAGYPQGPLLRSRFASSDRDW
jgi:hypothetical protein